MYPVETAVELIRVEGLPPHSAGAPMPAVFANGRELILAYETAPSGENVAVLRFEHPRAHIFGPPNDEALHSHPLAKYGLQPYGIFEALHSPWVKELQRRNRVHKHHDPRRYDGLRHFVFTFHDSTFECLVRDVRVADILPNESSPDEILAKIRTARK